MANSLNVDYSTHTFQQLAQERPSVTTATSILSPVTSELITLTSLYVTNTTATAAVYSIYHDEDGSTYTQDTALAYQVTLAANSLIVLEVEVPLINPQGNLAIQSGTADALNFTLYGYRKSR